MKQFSDHREKTAMIDLRTLCKRRKRQTFKPFSADTNAVAALDRMPLWLR